MNYMKKLLYLLVIFSSISISSAMAATVDHFNLTVSPESAKIWEAFDLTIEAMDKSDSVVKNYEWWVLILSQTDPEAEFPSVLKDNSYIFKKSDEWKVKFENAIKFKKAWTQKIEVYDINEESVVWQVEVKITADSLAKADIEILSPEDGLTIWENKVKLTWKTKKNFQVKLFLNSKEVASLNSNDDWSFEKEITDLQDWENVLSAKILDADNNVIWESKSVKIKVSSNVPKIKSVKIVPNKDVEPESKLNAEVIANKWLSEVSLLINDVIFKMEEKWEWVYRWIVIAPKDAWDYRVDWILKDDMWHVIKELWVETVSVKLPELKSWDINVWQNPNSEDIPKNSAKDLKITWLRLVELKTKSILTWDKLKDAIKYNVYKKLENGDLELITTVDEPKFELDINLKEKNVTYDYFYVKAVAKTESWETYEWDLSDATKIQTWPEVYILVILSILLWGFVLYKKKYYKQA